MLRVNTPKAGERFAWGAVNWFGDIAAVMVSALIGWVIIMRKNFEVGPKGWTAPQCPVRAQKV